MTSRWIRLIHFAIFKDLADFPKYFTLIPESYSHHPQLVLNLSRLITRLRWCLQDFILKCRWDIWWKNFASLYCDAIHDTCKTVLHNTCQSKKSFQIKKLRKWLDGDYWKKVEKWCWQNSETVDIFGHQNRSLISYGHDSFVHSSGQYFITGTLFRITFWHWIERMF